MVFESGIKDVVTAIYLFISFFILLLSLGVFVFVLYITIIGDIKGAPFTKSSQIEIQTMFDFAAIKKNETIIDLGSGDGTILIETAKRGAKAIGIELNPFLVWYSRMRVKLLGYEDKVSVKYGDFKKFSIKDADVVFLYLLPKTTNNLQKKLTRELKFGARTISNGAHLEGWIPEKERNSVFFYRNLLSCKTKNNV